MFYCVFKKKDMNLNSIYSATKTIIDQKANRISGNSEEMLFLSKPCQSQSHILMTFCIWGPQRMSSTDFNNQQVPPFSLT